MLRDLYKGKFGLAKTYWLWGVLGGLVVGAGRYGAIFIATKNVTNELLYDSLITGSSLVVIIWTIFISMAIINSAYYERERGFWGWVASTLAAIGIVRVLILSATLLGLMSLTWRDIENGVRIENLALPVQIEEGLIFTKMVANSDEKSLSNYFKFDYETLNEDTFDLKIAKEGSLESCADYKDFLEGPVEKIIIIFEANDGTTMQFEILPEDCGY